jgi:predicted N-acetyltransferase YhbS
MEVTSDWTGREKEIADLFTAVFTASEGAEEGRLVGGLAKALLATTPEDDLHVFLALEEGRLAGCVIFTRLTFTNDDRTVFLLSPVAVATGRQLQGVGRNLLTHGLRDLRARGVDVAVTYGDPDYYAKVGFVPVTETQVPAPWALAHPHGWLAQSLTDRPLEPLKGPSACAPALDSPDYW